MKKVLITILIIVLAILAYFLISKNITIFQWKSTSISDIKNMDSQLDAKIDEAVTISNLKYPESIETLETSIRNLKLAKKEYENKMQYVSENVELGVVQVKQYKIERLWIVLQNYAKDRNVELKLEVIDTNSKNSNNLYDLNVTLIGDYIGITDFIYDIENDDTLEFNISNFKLVLATGTTTSNATTKKNDEKTDSEEDSKNEENTNTEKTSGSKLQATFEIEGVGIQFN